MVVKLASLEPRGFAKEKYFKMEATEEDLKPSSSVPCFTSGKPWELKGHKADGTKQGVVSRGYGKP